MDVQSPPAGDATAASSTALYCYGVTWSASEQPDRAVGIGGESVGRVSHREIAALTTPVEGTKVRARRRDLLSHSDVLSMALEQGTVLPLRFGVVFQSEAELVESFLRPRHDELTALLRTFEGRA